MAVVAVAAAVAVPLIGVTGLVLTVSPPVEPFAPVAWRPAPGFTVDSDDVDARAAADIRPLVDSPIAGPEDLAVDSSGLIYTGTRDGEVVRVDPGRNTVETFATVGGRPLGMEFHPSGDLIVANHGVGLQAVAPDGEVSLLAGAAGGEPIRFANDLAVADDGVIYFSDSNREYHSASLGDRDAYSFYDFVDGRALGRLLRHDPATGATTVLRDGLYFPNGIVVTADQRALLVVESTRYRITRHWLDGPQAGSSEVFLADLPGIGDGFTRDEHGHLLLPMYDRVSALDRFILPYGWTRQVAVRAGGVLASGQEPAGSILVLTGDGLVLRQITGISPAPANVVPYGDGWLLGSLTGDRIRVLPAAGAGG